MTQATVRAPFECTIGGKRGDEWERAVGTRTFPVQSWVATRANLPGLPEASVYMLDLKAIDGDLLARITAYLSGKDRVPASQVLLDITRDGLPILAEDCSVRLNDPQRWI
jgi:hypothetical protein